MKNQHKYLVVTPTYNEAENVELFISAVLKCCPLVDILIMDDNSPDKTAVKVKRRKAKDESWKNRVYLLKRPGKLGLGTAYCAGFGWALNHNYDFVISMDADFSHDPKDLPKLLNANSKTDIVTGSRYIRGGGIVGWSAKRYANSYLANIATRLMLGISVKDVTAGFKRYNKKAMKYLLSQKMVSSGYAFQVETVFLGKKAGLTMSEVPITFVDRRVGESKIAGELNKSIKIVWRLFVSRTGARQFIKFIIVGAINTLLDWIVFFVIKTPLAPFGQLGKQTAKAGSFIVSGSSSYFMNRRWTFRSTDDRVTRQAAKFFVVAVAGLVFNNIIFFIVTAPNYMGLSDISGLMIATAIVMFWNFFINKRWTFK